MKKLIAMIGAVATCFGLYATDLVESAISFEADDAGSSGATLDITAGDARQGDAVLWATDAEDFDAPKIKAYADETAPIDAYDGYGSGKLRRDSAAAGKNWFINGTTSDKYLSLSTGTNSLIRTFADKADPLSTVTVSEGLFVDTLVRFTGYEEDPVITEDGDEKVAIWLKAIEDDPDTEEDEGTTNLYITCGRSYDSGDKLVTLEITNKGYAPEKWYRLTIKSIGDIFNKGDEHRLGFLVWIDGEQIACEGATDLVQLTGSMTQKAAEYQRLGQLFPSIKTGLTLTGAGFQGMGQIDDLIVSKADAAGGTPDFANEINFTITADGAQVLAVTNSLGQEVKLLDGVFTVKPGTVIDVYFGANGPYVLKNPVVTGKIVDGTTVVDGNIDLTDEVDADPAVAQVNYETYYATLNEAFAAAEATGEAATVLILDATAPYNPTGDELDGFMMFPENSLVIIDEGVWSITPDVLAEEAVVTDTYGVAAGKSMIVACDMILAGNIGADDSITVMGNATVEGLSANGSLTVMGTLTAGVGAITLGLKGEVKATVGTFITDEVFTNEADDLKVTGPDADELYTYTLKGGVEFTLTAPDNTTITGVSGAEPVAGKDNTYTAEDGAEVTVTLKADEGYLFENKTDTTTEKITAADGEITLQTAPTKAAAKKGGMFFITLQDAIDDSAEGDITLLANVALDAAVTLAKDETINLGGFTLSSTVASGYAFRAGDNALVLSNGTFTSTFRGVEVVNGSVTFGDGLTATTAKRTAQVLDGTGTITVAEGATVGSTDTNSGEPTLMTWLKVASDYEGDPASIVVNGTVNAAGKGVAMYGYGDLLVTEDAVVQTSGNASAVDMRSIYDDNAKQPVALIQGTLKCTSSTDNGENVCFTTFGTDNVIGVNATIDTTAVLVSDNGLAIYFPSAGSLTVKGSVTGANGIWVKGGATAVIDGATVTATATDVEAYDPANVDHSGCPSCGNAIAFSQEAGYAGVSPNTTITGGIFTSAAGAAIASYAETGYERLTGFVAGGQFGGTVAPATDLIAVGPGQIAKWTTNEQGYLVPGYDTIMIAKNLTTEKEYAWGEFATAISEAEDGETIQMLADTTVSGLAGVYASVDGEKAITLDWAGKTVTVAGDWDVKSAVFIRVRGSASLTLTNSVGNGGCVMQAKSIPAKTDDDNNWMFECRENAELVFNGGKYIHEGNGNYYDYIVSFYVQDANHARMTINDGTFVAGDTAFRPQCGDSKSGKPGDVIMVQNGGTVTSTRGVMLQVCSAQTVQAKWIQNGGTNTVSHMACYAWPNTDVSESCVFEVNGGTLNLPESPTGAHASILSAYLSNYGKYGTCQAQDAIVVNITGGNINLHGLPIIRTDDCTALDVTQCSTIELTGGTYDENINTRYADNIPAYCKVDVDIPSEGYSTVSKIEIPLTVVLQDPGVADAEITINDKKLADGQKVVFGDVIAITDITYDPGYEEGEVKVGDSWTVDADDIASGALELTIDAQQAGVAEVDGVKYTTLAGALDAVKTATVKKVTLLADNEEYVGSLKQLKLADATLDLNGHALGANVYNFDGVVTVVGGEGTRIGRLTGTGGDAPRISIRSTTTGANILLQNLTVAGMLYEGAGYDQCANVLGELTVDNCYIRGDVNNFTIQAVGSGCEKFTLMNSTVGTSKTSSTMDIADEGCSFYLYNNVFEKAVATGTDYRDFFHLEKAKVAFIEKNSFNDYAGGVLMFYTTYTGFPIVFNDNVLNNVGHLAACKSKTVEGKKVYDIPNFPNVLASGNELNGASTTEACWGSAEGWAMPEGWWVPESLYLPTGIDYCIEWDDATPFESNGELVADVTPVDGAAIAWKPGTALDFEHFSVTVDATLKNKGVFAQDPQWTVTFVAPAGATKVPEQQTVWDGENATEPETDPELSGKVFKGWFTDDTYAEEFDFENTAIVDDTSVYAKFEADDPIPPEQPADEEEVEAILDTLEDAEALKAIIKTPAEYTAFQTWAHNIPGKTSADVAASMKAAISYQLSPIVATATLFTAEPAVKFTAIAQSGTDWNATMELKDGDTAVQLKAAVDAYANFVKVGNQVTNITTPATITAAVNAEETKIVLTVTPPTGDAGFIKFTTAK